MLHTKQHVAAATTLCNSVGKHTISSGEHNLQQSVAMPPRLHLHGRLQL